MKALKIFLKKGYQSSVIRRKGESPFCVSGGKNVCVSGGKKCLFFGKFGVLCFLETHVLRFAVLPYYRHNVLSIYFHFRQIKRQIHCIKKVHIRSCSGPHFPSFGLNTERCGVQMRENEDQNSSEYGHFSRSDLILPPFQKSMHTKSYISKFTCIVLYVYYAINHITWILL